VLSFGLVAPQRVESEEREGIVGLIRETVDSLRDLIADHIKLARVEMVSDAKTYGRSIAVLVVAGVVVAIGYIFGLIAAALALARVWGTPVAFVAVGALHLVVGGVAVASAVARMRRTHPMHDTVVEAKDSLSALARPLQGRAS
jgi:VIT1/CCC1 family predicted Fe2+/Mn2+ transporter